MARSGPPKVDRIPKHSLEERRKRHLEKRREYAKRRGNALKAAKKAERMKARFPLGVE